MKNLIVIFGIFFGVLLFSSCSKDNEDDSDNNNLTDTELLVRKSPWNFNYFELIHIVDSNGTSLTQQEIENHINQEMNGISYNFEDDSTGRSMVNGVEQATWNWYIANNKLTLIIPPPNSITQVLDFEVSATQFYFESQAHIYDEEINVTVYLYGKFVYN